MSPQLIGGIGVCGLFSLLIIRVPVWVALTLVGFLGNVALIGVGAALATLGTIPFDTASLYGLSVIPLFILTGSIASGTGLSAELFKAARVILSGVRGGLSLATIGASACFGAVCGSSIATAATMTRIALREMRSAGYGDALSTGSIAAGGSLGILFPPSIILVIYGAIAEQSVPKLFAAGLIPGLVLTALYRGSVDWCFRRHHAWRGQPRANDARTRELHGKRGHHQFHAIHDHYRRQFIFELHGSNAAPGPAC